MRPLPCNSFGGSPLRLLLAAVVAGGCAARTPVVRYEPPPPPPPPWQQLLGEYASGPDTVIVLERDGSMQVLRRGAWARVLSVIRGDTFRVAASDTIVVFARDSAGHGRAFSLAGSEYVRSLAPLGVRETFRIAPRQPIAELRRTALGATPPAESDTLRAPELVELVALDSTIKLDIRYATNNNFMGAAFYSSPRAFLQRPAAEALVRVHRRLRPLGFGLLVFDAYRPWHVTKMFWDATPDSLRHFVADPARGSRHNRGAAVDLTLYELATGAPVEMVSGYDEFSPRAAPDYPGGTTRRRWYRDLLRSAMAAEGFSVYEHEWWHFDHRDWGQYPIVNLTFEQLVDGR